MYDTAKLKKIYSKIQKQLFYMIPEKWDRIYLYASVDEKINNLETGEMFFYYFPKGILKKKPINVYEVPNRFNFAEDEYLELVDELYSSIQDLKQEFIDSEMELWTNLTIKIEGFKFIIEYNFDDLTKSKYNSNQRAVIWIYNNLKIPAESMKKEDRDIINEYLKESINFKPNIKIYSEAIYKKPVRNVIQYKKEQVSYIYKSKKGNKLKDTNNLYKLKKGSFINERLFRS